MSNLATIRATVRTDLHDEDTSNQRWSDAELNRHIARALQEYSLHAPLETKSTVQTTAGSRDLSVSSLTPRIRLVAAEYPTGAYPPNFVPFSLWGKHADAPGNRRAQLGPKRQRLLAPAAHDQRVVHVSERA